jgi:hypothetical protein
LKHLFKPPFQATQAPFGMLDQPDFGQRPGHHEKECLSTICPVTPDTCRCLRESPFDIKRFAAATAEEDDHEESDPDFEPREADGDQETAMNEFVDWVQE